MAFSDDFISKLENFTDSLESLVESLKDQQKNSPTENLDTFLENFDAGKISSIVESLTEIKETNKQLLSGQKEILEAVKTLKSQKDEGPLGDLKTKSGNSVITDGIKVIMMMAGGILAVGVAFKLVGDVDFLSVVSLSMAMFLLAKTYAEIAKIKELSYKNAVMVSSVLPIMALGLVLSGGILATMPSFGIVQAISIGFVGMSMGIASYFLLKSLGGFDIAKNMPMLLTLPVILPIIATGLVVSGMILAKMPSVSFTSMITAIGVSIALVPMMIATGFMVKYMKDVELKDILILPTIIPMIAGSIVAAAYIFEMLPTKVDYLKVALTGLSVGLAIISMVPTIMLLEKAGLLKPSAIKSLMIGMVAIPLIATAIVASSWIFSLGKYDGDVPGFMWTLKTGLALVVFSIPMLIVGMMAMTGVGLAALGMALAAIPLIAAGVVISSWILSTGTYDKYPDVMWTLGVGLSIFAFGTAMVGLGGFILLTGGIGFLALAMGFAAIPLVAASIVVASEILSKGNYQKYPNLSWASGVGLSLAAFGMPMIALGAVMLTGIGALALYAGASAIETITESIVKASFTLSTGKYGTYPTLAWASGVALTITAFSAAFAISSAASLLSGLFGGKTDFIGFITLVSTAIVTSAEIFNKSKGSFDINKVPSKAWAEGVVTGVAGFAEALIKIGDIGSFLGFGGMDVKQFKSAIIVIAESLIAASDVFNKSTSKFDISKVPSIEWSTSVGNIVNSFSGVLNALSGGDIEFDDPDELNMITYAFQSIAKGIVAVGTVFSGAKFDSYPSQQWSEGVSSTLKSYTGALKLMDDVNLSDSGDMLVVFNHMKGIAITMGDMSTVALPDGTWINNMTSFLGDGISAMSKGMNSLDSVNISNSLKLYVMAKSMKKYTEIMSGVDGKAFSNNGLSSSIAKSIEDISKVIPGSDKIDALHELAGAISKVGDSIGDMNFDALTAFAKSVEESFKRINEINVDKVNSLVSFSMGLNALALVDNVKLTQTLNTLQAKKKELTTVIDSNGAFANIQSNTSNYSLTSTSEGKQPGLTAKSKDEIFREKLLTHVESIDNSIKNLSINNNTPEETKPPKGENAHS